jgi:prohibitin 2
LLIKNEFENAVESKVVAIQKAEEAKNNTVKIKEEAQQRIISAKAEAESMRIRANALTANKNLIEYEQVQVQRNAIDKWNGVLPAQMLGGAVPFINVNK